MRYYDDLWNQNQDVMVNGLGNDTVKQGSDEWYALLKKATTFWSARTHIKRA